MVLAVFALSAALLAVTACAEKLQVFGHALNTGQTIPPRCVQADETSHLLWVDWALKPPGPAAHVVEVKVAWHTTLPVDPEDQAVFVAQLRRNGSTFSLKDLQRVKLFEVDVMIEEQEEQPAARVLWGELNLVLDVDGGDVLGLLDSCEGTSPLSAPWAHAGEEEMQHWALAFTVGSDLVPGTEVALSSGAPAMPPAWAFRFRSLDPAGATDQGRSGSALQLLARVLEEAKCSNEDSLLKNLRSLSGCSWVHEYPIYILHTGHMERATEQELLMWMDVVRTAASPSLDLRFIDVSDDFQTVKLGDGQVRLDRLDLMWMDATRSDSPRIRKEKPRRHEAGYRHMCRFQSSNVLELPAFQRMRYLLHLDSDATFQCEGSRSVDPFKEMIKYRSVYGLFEVGLEDPAHTQGWSSFVKEWVLLNDLQLPNPPALLSTAGIYVTLPVQVDGLEQMQKVPLASLSLTWGTAWEVLDLDFFHRPDVLEFSRRVEATLGHYRHLWGDHLIRAYQVLLHASLEQVRCFDTNELHGSHGCSSDGMFDAEEVKRGEDKGWENIYQVEEDISCPDLWLENGLRGVPWQGGPGSGTSPKDCLQLCNGEGLCQGFDFVYYSSTQTADCVLRHERATSKVCQTGGVAGAAMEAWSQIGLDSSLVTQVGAANRYQIIERTAQRQMDCSAWREASVEIVRICRELKNKDLAAERMTPWILDLQLSARHAQASQSINALQDEKTRLLLEVEEAEDEARQWQRMAVVLLQRVAAGGAATRTRTAFPARRITSLQPPLVVEVPDEVQEVSAQMLNTRILRQELAFSQARLQQEEAEVEQLVADLEDLRMKELSAEATVQHREWHSATVQSLRQSIAKQAQAIAMYKDRARRAELHLDRLRDEILQLRQEEAKAATEECRTMSRRTILENDRQSELRSVTLALCEELASSNHAAESVLEEQLNSSHVAQRRVSQGSRLRLLLGENAPSSQ
ncbi:KTR4 [Symbiodinium sp. CCMP2456]|nr:KTR4 [Symbiodinium sp. CCMP2456]